MTRSSVVLLAVAVLLGGAYACFFSDWFTSPRIQIIPQIRPMRGAGAEDGVYPVSFTLDGKYRLTSVKVIEAGALQTNKFPAPVWHLISKTNSLPLQGLIYGRPIQGMKPSIPGATPQPLAPDRTYRLLLEAGRAKGSVDFKTHEVAPGN